MSSLVNVILHPSAINIFRQKTNDLIIKLNHDYFNNNPQKYPNNQPIIKAKEICL